MEVFRYKFPSFKRVKYLRSCMWATSVGERLVWHRSFGYCGISYSATHYMRGNVSEYRDMYSETFIAHFFMARQLYGPRPPHYWDFKTTLKHTTFGRTLLGECLTTIPCVISQKSADLTTYYAAAAWNPALILSKTWISLRDVVSF